MAIKFKELSYIYNRGLPYENVALDKINLEIHEGVITAIIGETGSGKSTLVEHLNALLIPSEGSLEVLDFEIVKDKKKNKNLKELRKEVGLVFQFSEYQLFEETILKDVAFGPKNFGYSEEEAIKRAKEALKIVGIPEELYEVSPLDISGGQKRRVAIAGIIAIGPQVMVLDEPTAGLDPKGADEIISLFVNMNKKLKKTIIIVSHDMDMVYNYSDETVVLANGKVGFVGKTVDFFNDKEKLKEFNILEPQIVTFRNLLKDKGFKLEDEDCTVEAVCNRVAKEVRR